MSYLESAFVFVSRGQSLPAILAAPEAARNTGVLLVVGGPQYRVGSHRQFVLLSRALAAAGIPVLRFDSGGMGDASGPLLNFEQIGADIAAAVDVFFARQPGLQRVVLWGLCDAASASLFYAWRDPRVQGLVLLNPWVRTDAGLAQAYVQHYYRQRLLSREFWGKLLGGGVDVRGALKGFWSKLKQARKVSSTQDSLLTVQADSDAGMPLPQRMLRGMQRFNGRVLLILSGDDLTAAEFRNLVAASPEWLQQMQGQTVQVQELTQANHTFSRRVWREQVERWTIDWVQQ
jgi:exosortase A-associated hydrolase 1